MTISSPLLLIIIAGALCGVIAFFDLRRLRAQVEELQSALAELRRGTEPTPREPIETDRSSQHRAGSEVDQGAVSRQPEELPKQLPEEWPDEIPEAVYPAARPAAQRPRPTPAIVESLTRNWMTWLGGTCVTLAGIFLVRYSMEQGLLGPLGRIGMALVFGLVFHVVAEVLRRKTGSAHAALGALAGAGCMILYAALFAAMRLYNLIEANTAFFLMAVVALGTMVMARLHGPVLAAFGILGAYLVPILVSDGSGEILIALVYALVVSASALLLMRYVYRRWLWWGFASGALGWWLITLIDGGADGYRTLYLTTTAYLLSAIPRFDWRLRYASPEPDAHRRFWNLRGIKDVALQDRVRLFGLFVLAIAVTIVANPAFHSPWLIGLPFFVLSLFIARRDAVLLWLPWAIMLTSLVSWLAASLDFTQSGTQFVVIPEAQRQTFLAYLALQAFAAAVFALATAGAQRRLAAWPSLATLAPVLSLAAAYMLTARTDGSLQWALVTLIMALSYLAIAVTASRRASESSLVTWLFIAGHFALALSAAMAFRSASLTLALAAQLVSLAWVIQYFRLPGLAWLMKLVVAIVITRLTLNPWLPSYPTDVHWSLWTYGGATACAALGAYLLRGSVRLSAWLEAAALHLFVLTVWAELRYQLYDGVVFAAAFTLAEAVSTMALSACLALVYYRRALLSENLARYLRIYSRVLLGLSLILYAIILLRTLSSDPWVYRAIANTPVWNLLLGAFALPPLIGLFYALYFEASYRRAALLFTGFTAFISITLEIRHLWASTVRLDSPPVSDYELYSYSVVWMLIAVAGVLLGAWRFGKDCYRGGMLLLALVILKLFLVDFSDLQGLLRVASFMGLGLSLLGISFLHRRLGYSGAAATT